MSIDIDNLADLAGRLGLTDGHRLAGDAARVLLAMLALAVLTGLARLSRHPARWAWGAVRWGWRGVFPPPAPAEPPPPPSELAAEIMGSLACPDQFLWDADAGHATSDRTGASTAGQLYRPGLRLVFSGGALRQVMVGTAAHSISVGPLLGEHDHARVRTRALRVLGHVIDRQDAQHKARAVEALRAVRPPQKA